MTLYQIDLNKFIFYVEKALLPALHRKDNQYLVDGKDYIDATYDNVPYTRMEKILVRRVLRERLLQTFSKTRSMRHR